MKILLNEKFKKDTTEYRIIELVNENPEIFKDKTINQIADLLFVNASSVSRAVIRMGYKSYKDFRDNILYKVEEIKDIKHLDHYDKIEELINNFKFQNKFAIDETLNNINPAEIDLIIDEITSGKTIYLYGIGFSEYMCNQLNKYFRDMKINSYNLENFYDALKVFSQYKKEDVQDSIWIIISKTLTTKEICFIQDELKARNIDIILITSSSKSEYYKNAKHKILLKTMHKDDDFYSLNSKISLLVITNLLIDSISNRLGLNKKEAVISFAETSKSWKQYNYKFNK
ncbi:MurR/RpiR family transcriptional regulator [Mesoplasma photuris]|uniref:MurR/RpiR family transcriptional regulator n=1 Tax=Mesoplasma photuris TaxID=217731 RepID=UPI0004E1D0C5|nr:MurR/RpiR family transcriptional regulator [Mesoplasma photuris]